MTGWSPPLGASDCRSAGRGLILVGPQYCLGAWWVWTADPALATPVLPPPVPPIPPPLVPEGSIPWLDDLATP
jgi:hypothetical protein